MKIVNNTLAIIIPSVRGYSAIPTIESALNQIGFNKVNVIISGKSTLNNEFIETINNKFKTNNLFIAKCINKLKILPGEARNIGLNLIKDNKIYPKYILFLDDDVVIPKKYCKILVEFLKRTNSCAVMGRISSRPKNLWTKIIDYSNFWWLQTTKDIDNIKWIATTATFTKYEYVKSVRFEENISINEDVIFFNKVTELTNKKLCICSSTTGLHYHDRKNLKELLRYQFNNGFNGVLYHNQKINLINAIKDIRDNYYSSYRNNINYLKKHHLIKYGVILSFTVFEIGVQSRLFFNIIKKNKKTLFNKTNTFLKYINSLLLDIKKYFFETKLSNELIDNIRRNWESYAKIDPMWSILTYKSKKDKRWRHNDFFKTGELEINKIIKNSVKINHNLKFNTAMDFGCGIGRLSQALCKYFDKVYGIDISNTMIKQAKKFNKYKDRCIYHINTKNNLRIFTDNSFDFIYSNIVLQHNKPIDSESYIREFIRTLKPHGLLVFQIPSSQLSSNKKLKPLSMSGFKAKISLNSPIKKLYNDSSYIFEVNVENISNLKWNSENKLPISTIRLGNHWLDKDKNMIQIDDGRTSLQSDLNPGENILLKLPITTPKKPGTYYLELDMVQESVSWFSNKGSQPLLIEVKLLKRPRLFSIFNQTSFVPHMEMHCIKKINVIKILESCNGKILDILEDKSAPGWKSYKYYVTK